MKKPTTSRVWSAAGALLLFAASALADGLKISNVAIAPRDARTATVTFDIAWTNAYRFDSFHDATWVFFKVRPDANSPWQHARLMADKVVNPTGYSSGEGRRWSSWCRAATTHRLGSGQVVLSACSCASRKMAAALCRHRRSPRWLISLP